MWNYESSGFEQWDLQFSPLLQPGVSELDNQSSRRGQAASIGVDRATWGKDVANWEEGRPSGGFSLGQRVERHGKCGPRSKWRSKAELQNPDHRDLWSRQEVIREVTCTYSDKKQAEIQNQVEHRGAVFLGTSSLGFNCICYMCFSSLPPPGPLSLFFII